MWPFRKVEGSFRKELEVPEPVKLEVSTGSGDIGIKRGEEGRLKVTGAFQVWARTKEEAQRLAERIKADPPIEVAGGSICVGDLRKYGLSRWPFGSGVVIDFLIEAPKKTEARLNSSSGDQEVHGLEGPVRAEAGSGDVDISDIEGKVKVEAGSGDVQARNIGSIEADVKSGDVTLEGVSGDAEIEVNSGDVSIKDAHGDVKVEAGSGDISIDSKIGAGASWELEAGSGDVKLRLPKGSSFSLEARTGLGEIKVDFPLAAAKNKDWKLVGKVGEEPRATIRVETSSGDISIEAR
jgi:hypothetical protein